MPPSQQTPASSAGPELPSFADRLPDLTIVVRQVARELEQTQAGQSYLPYWEDLYASAHALKGVLKILNCPPVMAEFILGLNEALASALAGPRVCRKLKEAGALLQALAERLDQQDPAMAEAAFYSNWLRDFNALYSDDVAHEERIKEIPPHLFYVSEMVSKKAREIHLLNLNHCVVEDEIRLDDIPLWRTQLNEALVSPEFGRGMVVNFLPFISSEGSRMLKVWAWVAAATHSRAALKQRVKEVMPKATITKI